MTKEEELTDYDICKKCGGDCCKAMGCHLSPEFLGDLDPDKDYEEIKNKIKELLDTGNYSIDWWNGDTEDIKELGIVPYLRIRNVCSPIIDASWGGRCKLLTDNGCSLSFEDRPKGGKYLIPNNEDDCEAKYDKKQSAKDFRKYHNILEDLIDEYR